MANKENPGPDKKLSLGKQGEQVSKDYLEQRGYKILSENYRSPSGEIDIVAEKEGTIIFVEVKTRKNLEFGDGMEAVTTSKKKRIMETALYYIQEYDLGQWAIRFDVISLHVRGTEFLIKHLLDVFNVDE